MYGGTKAELERLIADAASYTEIQKEMGITVDATSMSFDNIVNAIAVVQGHLGIAGATAAEASTTIEGSINSMKSAWSNLTVEIAKDNGDIEGSVNTLVDSVATVADNIAPRVEQALNGVVTLIDKLVPKIVEAIPKFVTNFAPKLVNSGVNILKSLVKGIKNNAKTIVKSAKDLILNFIDGMVDMLPDIIDAGVELLEGIVEAIPEVATKIVKSMPKIITAITTGLAKGVGAVFKGVRNLFSSVDEELDAATKRLADSMSDLNPFLDAVSEAASKTADLSNALSENGNTISDLDSTIEEVESSITEILKTAFSDQKQLRDKDLQDIQEYQNKLKELNSEKLGIYQQQQGAITTRAEQLSKDDLTLEEASQIVGEAQSALSESNRIAKETYDSMNINAENLLNAGAISASQYTDMLNEATDFYNSSVSDNEKYYSETLGVVDKNSKKWVDIETNKWKAVGRVYKDYSNQLYSDDVYGGRGTIEIFGAFGGFDKNATVYADYLAQLDKESAAAFLSLQATVASAGEPLSEEAEDAVNAILSPFENELPDELEEQGKSALEYMIQGMETEIPELQNTAEMSTVEIVETLRKHFGIEAPLIGEEVMGGLAKGIVNGQTDANNTTTQSVKDITLAAKKTAETDSPSIGTAIADGITYGMNSRYPSLVSAGKAIADVINQTFRKAEDINSPSGVFKGFGRFMMQGLAIGLSDYSHLATDEIESLSNDISASFNPNAEIGVATSTKIGVTDTLYNAFNSLAMAENERKTSFDVSVRPEGTELGRALLNLIEITKKEVYG